MKILSYGSLCLRCLEGSCELDLIRTWWLLIGVGTPDVSSGARYEAVSSIILMMVRLVTC
jgi:hypothetical protein